MRSAFASLAWELWRKNRAVHLGLLGLLALGCAARLFIWLGVPHVSDAVGAGLDARIVMPALAAAAMILTFLGLVVIFSCADGGVPIAYPRRTFTLPVSTVVLVNGPILLGALTIAAFHAAWVCLFPLPNYAFDACTLLYIAALVAFQASVWCLSSYPSLLAAELALLAALFVRLGYHAVAMPGDLWPIVCLWSILGVSYMAAWIGVARQRHGDGPAEMARARLGDAAAYRQLQFRRAFSIPARAQQWMERRRAIAAPLLLAGVGVAVFGVFQIRLAVVGDFVAGGISTVWLFFFSSAVTFWAALSGLSLACDASSGSLSLSQFLATRPVASGELAWSKIKLGGGLALFGLLIYGLGVLAWIASVHAHHRLLREDEVVIIGLTACSLAWHLAGALPFWLAGKIPSVSVAGLLLLGGYIGLGNVVAYCCQHFGLLRGVLPVLLACGFAAKVLLASWAFWRCYRRQLLRLRAIANYVAVWLIVTICFVALAWKFCPESQIPRPIAEWLAALLFPLARIALSPLAVASARHR